jgi:hypothetical protein
MQVYCDPWHATLRKICGAVVWHKEWLGTANVVGVKYLFKNTYFSLALEPAIKREGISYNVCLK